MPADMERNLGEQPIARILRELNLEPHDLVAGSPEPLTHKMVARACKGRRLTTRMQWKILRALNCAAHRNYRLQDLFLY